MTCRRRGEVSDPARPLRSPLAISEMSLRVTPTSVFAPGGAAGSDDGKLLAGKIKILA